MCARTKCEPKRKRAAEGETPKPEINIPINCADSLPTNFTRSKALRRRIMISVGAFLPARAPLIPSCLCWCEMVSSLFCVRVISQYLWFLCTGRKIYGPYYILKCVDSIFELIRIGFPAKHIIAACLRSLCIRIGVHCLGMCVYNARV